MFPDNWALGFWALVIDLLILIVIVGEIVFRWHLKRRQARTDKAIMSFLSLQQHSKTIVEIAQATAISEKNVAASLDRLAENNRADYDEQQRWHKVRY